jgi:hypothetical protein
MQNMRTLRDINTSNMYAHSRNALLAMGISKYHGIMQ